MKPTEQPELSQAVVVREEQPVAPNNHDKTLDFLELAIREKADVGVIERMMTPGEFGAAVQSLARKMHADECHKTEDEKQWQQWRLWWD